MSALSLQGINQFYGQSHILRDLSLQLPAGQCSCLMGRNGVGKTTLLQVIMGLLPAASGQLIYEDEDLLPLAAPERARRHIGYVPQGRQIFAQMTVEENLRVGLGIPADGPAEIPDDIFELFPVLDDMRQRRGGDLSGGQQQQLAVGRALVLQPKLLILDEPCEGIQPNIVQLIGEVIGKLNRERGITVLLVEQKLGFARRVADRFALMERGRIVAGGDIATLSDTLVQQHLAV